MKRIVLILLCLLFAAGVWFFWPRGSGSATVPKNFNAPTAKAINSTGLTGTNHSAVAASSIKPSAASTNQLAFRLTNTSKTIKQLTGDRHAILLENAFIDTSAKTDLKIPSQLQSSGDPGAYIVQAKGTINAAFRAALARSGAQIVSYIPNNAYLVRLPAASAGALQAQPPVQAVLPYEPYYKISSSVPLASPPVTAAVTPAKKSRTPMTTLLELAVNQKPLPPGTFLTLGLFGDSATETIAQIQKLGGEILAQERSPFGQLVHVQPPVDWIALANLPGVQLVEPAHQRKHANDLSRPALGVSTDSITTTNYLNLSGKNVMVEVNDTGIDANHPDLTGRVFGDFAGSLLDTDGHGTFVAGEIAGDGTESMTVTNASGSINPGTNFQYRGKAPMATLFSVGGLFDEGNGEGGHDTNAPISDSYFQEVPALTNALISNNSWVNDGDMTYDLSAASYDAAVRDALPAVTGSQPVLFVFAAGNDGAGDDNGDGGNPDSIDSPGTAKNVITVGSLEEQRNITNVVTMVDNGTTNTSTPWSAETDTGYQVAGYSSRGNVGIGTEGTYGRYKPDVTAPGTFIVSTRSTTWDTNAYYNPTNFSFIDYTLQLVTTNFLQPYPPVSIPQTAVGVTIRIVPNTNSTLPFPTNLPLYVSLNGLPFPPNFDISSTSNSISIPPDSGGNIAGIQSLQGSVLNIAVGDNTSNAVNYDLQITITATNDLGDYYQQEQSLNDGLGAPAYYRYETGTSMAAAEVSGVLALMQDFFTNTLRQTPSPALLKALLINGARPTGFYDFQVQNGINYQGWGLVNLPNSIPATLTNSTPSTGTTLFYLDQSLTNALATGDSRTYKVAVSPAAQGSPLRVTLAWTDPPGNPAAAIKLVNNLELIVTNLDDPNNPMIYYGNDIAADQVYNTPESTNTPPNFDVINNVQNIYLPPGSGTNFSITIFGAAVNANAVTAQTNDAIAGTYAPNIVQDFALVVSSGDGSNTNGFNVTAATAASNPLVDQRISVISTNNAPLLNQFVGASSPLLGTNATSFAVGSTYAGNAVLTIGQTNQWHFYIVTNNGLDAATGLTNSDVTNAAFVTFTPGTLALPREGVFAGSDANSTRPEADLDLFVTTDSSLTNLNPVAISNCVNGVQQVGASSVVGVFNGSSLGRGGSEYVVDTNSTMGQVYYVGVQSEDQMASEYDFLSEFSSTPFSLVNGNGDETVQFFQVSIPDGSATLPGVVRTIGLAIFPINIQRVIQTNVLAQQNVGDLVVSLGHSTVANGSGSTVLLNHDSPNSPGIYTNIYDDSGQNDILGAQPADGPGSLQSFQTQEGSGVWVLQASDNAPGFVGSISGTMFIQKHQDLTQQPFISATLQPGQWFYGFVHVPVGYTNLTIVATNVSVEVLSQPIATPPMELYVKQGSQPTRTVFDEMTLLTNVPPSGIDWNNSISLGPPLTPGTYYVGLYNPSTSPQAVTIGAYLFFNPSAITTVDYRSTDTPRPILDDAVMTDAIFVTNKDAVQSINVGLRVDHPRISDLAFTLISPGGSRYLLMENRGGDSTNGCGSTYISTNTIWQNGFEGTYSFSVVVPTGTYFDGGWKVDFGNIELAGSGIGQAYAGTNFLDLDGFQPGGISTNISTIPGQTYMLNFAYARNPDSISAGVVPQAAVLVNGSQLVTLIPNQTNTWANPLWQATSFVFTATSPTTLLAFHSLDSGSSTGVLLDQVSLSTEQMNYDYLTFTEDTNLTTTPIKFAPPPFVLSAVLSTNFTLDDFESDAVGDYSAPASFGAWNVVNNQVSVVADPTNAYQGNNFLALANGVISNNLPTVSGSKYSLTFAYRGPGIVGFWRGENDAVDSINGNDGYLSNEVSFVTGEVGSAFHFDGVDDYIQVPASPSLDVGKDAGMTIDCWIKPADISIQRPIVVWTTNSPTTSIPVTLGPLINPSNGHYYYLLPVNNWANQEAVANSLGGYLATIRDESENDWIFTNITATTPDRNPYIGLISLDDVTWSWVSGEPVTYGPNWAPGEPNGVGGSPWGVNLQPTYIYPTKWNDVPQSDPYEAIAETTSGVDFWESVAGAGSLYANLLDTTNGSHIIYSAAGILQSNQYQHVAVTYDHQTGMAKLYCNGVVVANSNLGIFTPKTSGNVMLGKPFPNITGTSVYDGDMDEVSIYNRALSGSEIKAIFADGASGKFNPTQFTVSPSESLAQAQVNVNGGVSTNLYGDNVNWQEQTISFTATQTSTPIVISGIEPGMLLDDFTVSGSGGNSLYYQPEQSIAPLVGTSAFGDWQLEIWDSRTGATNDATLDSWQLEFQFANTNLPSSIVGSLAGGLAQTNAVGAGDIAWYAVNVPANASYATNLLLFATNLPVNVWFSTNYPPTVTNTGDVDLIPNSTGGSDLLSTNSTPLLVPGSTYYLGVQNTNTVSVGYAIEVNFDHGNATNSTLPLVLNSLAVSGGNLQFQWTAPAGEQFQVFWTTNLTTPFNAWNVTTGGITSSGTVYTFTDPNLTNTMRFYRLQQISP